MSNDLAGCPPRSAGGQDVSIGSLGAFVGLLTAIVYVSKLLLEIKMVPSSGAENVQIDKFLFVITLVSIGLSMCLFPLFRAYNRRVSSFFLMARTVSARALIFVPFAVVGGLFVFNVLPAFFVSMAVPWVLAGAILMLVQFDLLSLIAISIAVLQMTLTFLFSLIIM